MNLKDSNGRHCSLTSSAECNNGNKDYRTFLKKRNKYLRQLKDDKKTNQIEDSKFCFYKDALNEQECISYELHGRYSDNLSKDKPGIWAKSKCTYNEECPYYKKNRNYLNERGGCIDGVCEMPLNVKHITPIIADSRTIPLCHNCKQISNNSLQAAMCCDDQLDKNIYPKVSTPDYAFKEDLNERLEYIDELEAKNLLPFKLI